MIILFASFREGYGATVTNTVAEVTKKRPRTFRQFAREHARVFSEGK